MTQTIVTPPPEYKTACGNKLKDSTNCPSAMYRGERIFFCTQDCLRTFERDPDPLMAGKVEDPIHEEEQTM